ncbi:uncharacterized protein TRAVEDRAFT_62924 [Trametes versicolor FP-101664 SS1]|uniref:uncharacterized protein n=1 Tax=Trametes versicolor (strain FP-101664) TaxID=717944 RepID=UPI0004622FBF|nr:uncharacterized protein TRAVEDRAFT_62924 [Trametes versicolor FP-101664 SS1]EIW63390.1 hypothetical protein TRAVEDRAFT_62924 [Trametes versicolor FP-101664 SS1]
MFHFKRDAPSQSRQPEKPRSRPRSLSTRSSSSSSLSASAAANLHLLPRRAPLAPLDPQSTNGPLTASDDQMSSASSSSAFLGYNPADDSRDPDRARYNIGKPIIPRAGIDELAGNLPSSRRRSIPNQAQSSTTVSRPPQLQQRPLPRRATHTPSSSVSSSRRTSLPTILHQPAIKTAPSPPTTTTISDNANFLTATDDIYSNLSTFTFGAARPNAPSRRTEHISPFTVASTSGTDRTPRPSVSGLSNGSRTPRVHPSEGPEDEDEEEAARQTRAKMRAIDDGTRRPSLPINAQSGPSNSPSPPRIETDSEAELDPADDGEELDTDVEFDYRNFSREDISDAASQHTFGGGNVGHYPTSRIAGKGDDSLSITMSLIEQDDEDDRGDPGTSSPVTFARIRDSSGESSSSPVSSPSQSRRGSVPWNIPNAMPSARDREDSEVTILASGRRMSRSMDDELGLGPTASTSVQPTSQPTTRSDWQNLAAQVHVQPPPEEEENVPEISASDAYDGFNLQYVLGDPSRQSWSSGAPSYIAPGSDSRRGSIAPWEVHSISSGRRSSTTTMSDDAFTSQLRKLDKGYTVRRDEWSFRKENADGAAQQLAITTRPGRPAIHELWRHEYVGRFKVDKQWTEHPSKAPTQRINVRHIADPFSRGNTRGGPHSIIHRHSRAVAFSIFRKYDIFGRSAQKQGGTSFHVHTSGTILLAPMEVQTQFTSTRTTSQLNTYGHLNSEATSAKMAERLERANQKDRDKTKSKDKEKRKSTSTQKRLPTSSQTSDASQTVSMGSVASSAGQKMTDDDRSSKRHNSEPPSSPSAPVSPSLPNTSFTAVATASYAPSITTATTMSVRESLDTRSPSSSFDVTMSPADRTAPSIARMSMHQDDMDLDEDDEQSNVPRTSHAEAFATLDSGRIEYIRGRAEQHTDHDHAGGGLIDRLARRIRGQNTRVSSGKPAGPSSDMPFTSTAPPWVTLAPRSKQEERERVIQNLSESFKDVGLLPTFKTTRGERSKGKQPMKNNAGVNVFEEVPPEALHMLLPLWPCKTDDLSTIPGEDQSQYILPAEERQYLIVYYVPFDERKNKDKKKGDASKKRARASSVSAATTAAPRSKGIPKSAFRVCARLVGCHDFLGTGVRLPSEGLSISGSMAEAMAQLPSPGIREKHPGDVVIGMCSGRDKDVEFIPEGLASVGLCLAQQSEPPQPPSPVHEEEMMDAFDPVYSLTPIGRAAVEMAWLGCLAITFSDVAPPSTK